MESQLETNRLSLRPFNTNDLDSLHRLWTHPDVRRYLWDGIEITRERAAEEIAKSIESFNNRGFGFWALLLKEDKTLKRGQDAGWLLRTPSFGRRLGRRDSLWD